MSSSQQVQDHRHTAVKRVAGMNLDGTNDAGSPRGSRSGSNQGSRPGSRAGGSSHGGSLPQSPRGSQAAGSSTSGNPFGPSEGRDPARDLTSLPPLSTTDLVGKRIDLPTDAFKKAGVDAKFTKRPGFNTDSKPIKIQMNMFPIQEWPTRDVYQFDINVTPNPRDSRALVTKVWNSQPVQSWLAGVGGKWLYDGNKMAWNSKPIPRGEHKIAVDLDALAGKTVVGRDGVYYITIKQSTVVRMNYLKQYLAGRASWDNHVLECMNFLDHLMRQWPSETRHLIKRNFYSPLSPPLNLDNYTVVHKGTYSAFKLSESSSAALGGGLALNVDVANTAFWIGDTAAIVARHMLGPSGPRAQLLPWGKLADMLRPVKIYHPKTGRQAWGQSEAFKKLRRLAKLNFKVNHRGKQGNEKLYTIKGIAFDEAYGAKGADSINVHFDMTKGGKTTRLSVFEYFKNTYGGRLEHPDLPLVLTTRDGYFPMEVCTIQKFQRYHYKLDPEQTASMIKVAVSRPKDRSKDIMIGVNNLKWHQDPYFKEYGLKVSPNMMVSNARLLQNPEVHFGGGAKINPGVTGRWDLRGKKFLEPNVEPLNSWGFIGCGTNDGHAVQKDQLTVFAQTFVRTYKAHGGKIAKNPYVVIYPFDLSYADMCSKGYQETGNNAKAAPQILFFVVSTKNMLVYERIKKNMDCRFCTVSQVMLADHVKKANAQYCSNVSMKVNAKLGGVTCKAMPVGVSAPLPYYKVPTMFIGLDVTHGSPGANQPSMAAMTVSTDKLAARYAGRCETNGWRVEIVHTVTMNQLFDKLLKYWVATNGCPPQHVYFFRDGVSEGQFQHVIDYEVKDLKRMFKDANFPMPKFTVIVATKRHHVRFFPKPGDAVSSDKNSNSHPGTLVEYNATDPHNWDWFLSSHSAIQGTARPVHYHVIFDEAGCDPNSLQRMIYHHSYQYIRSTTPISIHPAIYYAHLASQRARSHENLAESAKEEGLGKAGFPIAKAPSSVSIDVKDKGEAPRLLPMKSDSANPFNVKCINTRMWYI